jgi:hypothetical protein
VGQNLLDQGCSAYQERLESCPSPLDEDETIVMLKSGEKMKVKEIYSARFD